jgi:hypothetical protein
MYSGIPLNSRDRQNQEGLEPTHAYFDLDITNNDTAPSRIAPNLSFDEIRQNAILSNPSDYFLSIVRFQVDTVALPVFIPQVLLGQADPDETIYNIIISDGTISGNKNLYYDPQDKTVAIPSASRVSASDLSLYYDPYYYQQNYIDLIRMVNGALQNASSDYVANGGVLPNLNYPFMAWDSINQKATLYLDTAWETASLFINFNAPLYTLFSSLPAVKTGQNIFQISTQVQNQNINIVTINAIKWVAVPQEYSTISIWSPVKSIVFTSSLLPVNASLSGDPVVFGVGSLKLTTGNNNNITGILTDFTADNYNATVQYTPSAEYRLFDLIQNSPLASIGLQAFWKDRFSNLIPFLLPSGCSASIKILFRKKSFNEGLK